MSEPQPSIQEALQLFVKDAASGMARSRMEPLEDFVALLRQFANAEGIDFLPETHRPLFAEAVTSGSSFCQAFTAEHILRLLPAFAQTLSYQQSIVPPTVLPRVPDFLYRLSRFLFTNGHGTEEDYLAALEALPDMRQQRDRADELSSMLYDLSREDPPFGKIQDELRGYVEIVRVHRTAILLVPLKGRPMNVMLGLEPALTALARPGWLIDARLVKTASGWQVLDVGNVLP